MFSETKIIIIIEIIFDYNDYLTNIYPKNTFYIAIYFNMRI